MPRGDKSKYTDKQERKADHIAESYEAKGVPDKEAERRAWATVNKDDGGGKNPAAPGAERKRATRRRIKAGVSAARPRQRTPAERSASARKAAETRKENSRALKQAPAVAQLRTD